MIGPLSIPGAVLFLSMATSSLSAPLTSIPFFPGDIFNCATPPAPPTNPTPTTCDNEGIAYAIQRHDFKNDFAEFPALMIDHFYRATPEQTGTTKRVGFTCGDPAVPCSIYGSKPVAPETIGVNHRGYFIPKMTGMYTISSASADDVYFFWLGQNAYNGKYTKENADCTASVGQPDRTCSTILFQGYWYPYRILLVNGLGPTSFVMKITGPDGRVIMSDSSDYEAASFAQFSCDGSSPPFQPFGQETA